MNAPQPLTPAIHQETPTPGTDPREVWGSDVVAAMLRAIDVPFVALNPGASYRGLHDSLVNYLGNARPQMLLCLHEESAVAIAHGYAKATGRMMAAALHSNVGLMHGTMAIFNAWCDRVPMLVLGATGPWDAAKRRPWIDWIHTVSDQGALVRDYTKWDNQPGSALAAMEAITRANQIANTAPCGPTYINLDAAIQEGKVGPMPALPEVKRFQPPPAVRPAPEAIAQAVALLSAAKRPLIMMGRTGRSEAQWNERVALAERLRARVITDIKMPAAFPTDHPLHVAPPATFFPPAALEAIREADVILSLDWNDLAGALKQAYAGAPIGAKVIKVSLDQHVHRGWSADYQGLPPADVYLLCEPDPVVPLLTDAVKARSEPLPAQAGALPAATAKGDAIGMRQLADAFNAATEGRPVSLTRLPLGWNGAYRHFRHPLDYLGGDGGAGIGSGPGMTVGAALGLKGSGRIVAAVLGDGDFLMGNTALWTATHYGIPALFVVANNRSFYNDEVHQERVAKERGRPVENKWIGQRISGPDIDFAMMGKSQGAAGFGPVERAADLPRALAEAIAHVEGGGVAVVDVRVEPGYDTNMSGAPAAAGKR